MLPVSMMLLTMFLTWFSGMAKPMLSMEASLLEDELEYLAFVIPMTSP